MPKKQQSRVALRKWVSAAKAEGYLKKGAAFKRLPRKGTQRYRLIKCRYDKK